jgi:hypothetical protein
MYFNIKSRQGNTAAHIFFTVDGWTWSLPLKKEDDVHEVLYLLPHRDCVPEVMVVDGSKAQVQGEFRKKLRECGVHVNQTEPLMQPQKTLVRGSSDL